MTTKSPSNTRQTIRKKSPTNSEKPWTIKGIAVETRTAAKKAARREGMTLGAWVDRTLRESANTVLTGKSDVALPNEAIVEYLAELRNSQTKLMDQVNELKGTVNATNSKKTLFGKLFG